MIGGCGALPHALAGEGRFRARRTENGACRREAPNLPRLRRTERPCGATIEGAVSERRSRRPSGPICPMGPTAKPDDVPQRVERGPKREDDGREGAISGRLARKATGVSPSGFARTGVFTSQTATGTPQQEMQEIQEIQERPVNGRRREWGRGAEPHQEYQSANQPISVSAPRSAHSWGRSREWSSVRMDWARRRATRGRASWMPVW